VNRDRRGEDETMNHSTSTPDRTWDVLCHLAAMAMFIGVPFGNILGPLIIWLIKKSSLPSVDEHGKEALNFQISMTLYTLIGGVATIVLVLTVIGILLVPVVLCALLAIAIVDVVLIIVASLKASNGEVYRYPLSIRFVN
jgi:uncharacterized protein